MNSALKPVLSTSSQNTAVASTLNKTMHPQGAPPSYGQPSGHMSQNPYPNMNVAHNHPNAQPNHYSLNVPNATTHFIGGGMGTIPPSNHPVANINQSSGQLFNPPKNVTYSSGYQPILGHPPNQNTLPPVSQTLPATSQSQQNTLSQSSSNSSNSSTPTSQVLTDKPQSNGTPEVKFPAKTENQGNRVSPTKDKPQTPASSQVPQTSQKTDKVVEKPKTTPSVQELKPTPEPSKALEELKVSSQTSEIPGTKTNVSSSVASSSSNLQAETVSLSPTIPETDNNSKAPTEKETKLIFLTNTEIKSISAKETTPKPSESFESSAAVDADKDNKSNEPSEKKKNLDESTSVGPVHEMTQVSPNASSSKLKEQY